MSKLPRRVFDDSEMSHPLIFAFPPNRETLGGTAYLIVEKTGNLLVDCPAWNETNQTFIHEQGGVRTLLITHRGAIANVKIIQQTWDCDVVIQEQEAFLVPGVKTTPFHFEWQIDSPTAQS
jgi:hypothetical protein